jgi:hypothetical protein
MLSPFLRRARLPRLSLVKRFQHWNSGKLVSVMHCLHSPAKIEECRIPATLTIDGRNAVPTYARLNALAAVQHVAPKTDMLLCIRKLAATAAAERAVLKASGASARLPDVRGAFLLADAHPVLLFCRQGRMGNKCRLALCIDGDHHC